MFYTRGAINMALALPASPPFDKEVLLDTTAGKDGGGNVDPHGNKEGEDLQLEGQGGGGSSNQTKKTKVRALFLELFTTMPYTAAFAGGLYLITISHLFIIINLLCVPDIMYIKGGEAKVDEGQLLLHGNKEDVDLQLDGRSGNQTKKKVRAMFLKLYTTMPWTTAFIVARGVI